MPKSERRHPNSQLRSARGRGCLCSSVSSPNQQTLMQEEMVSLQTLVGVELPIIQAPMAGVQGSALAVAVSNAGGLGSLPAALLTPEALRTELAQITAQTD